jgi:hypothetical protein
MLAIFGHLVGWALTVGIKMLFLLVIRGLYVKALYRDRPGAFNVVNLALECWHIGLAAGYIFFQAICLLTQTTIAIGQADTALPQAFRKDLVVSEANRHPYIQRLTVFYLTKLRHGPKFCTRAGSCWRLIYVLALMPWLKKNDQVLKTTTWRLVSERRRSATNVRRVQHHPPRRRSKASLVQLNRKSRSSSSSLKSNLITNKAPQVLEIPFRLKNVRFAE